MPIHCTGLSYSRHGLIMLEFAKDQILDQLHHKTLEIFNPLRNNYLREKYQVKALFDTLPIEEQQLLQRYGHIYVLDRYHPHISLARISNPDIVREVVSTYSTSFADKTSQLSCFQLLESISTPTEKNIVLFSKPLAN